MTVASGSWVTPFVVTRNSAPWIVDLLRIYRENGLEPFAIVDDRSTDGTAESIARADFRMRRATCMVDRAEPMVADVLREIPRGWLLRMDDDEVPSARLFDYLRGPEPTGGVIGFARRFYQRDALGQLYRARWMPRSWLYRDMRYDWQYRLFRAEDVEFSDAIHTPGIVIPEHKTKAPPGMFIAHLVWILRSLDQRRAKIASYDAQKEFAGSFFKPMYVPEDLEPGEVVMFRSPSHEFDAIASIMAAAQGHAG